MLYTSKKLFTHSWFKVLFSIHLSFTHLLFHLLWYQMGSVLQCITHKYGYITGNSPYSIALYLGFVSFSWNRVDITNLTNWHRSERPGFIFDSPAVQMRNVIKRLLMPKTFKIIGKNTFNRQVPDRRNGWGKKRWPSTWHDCFVTREDNLMHFTTGYHRVIKSNKTQYNNLKATNKLTV